MSIDLDFYIDPKGTLLKRRGYAEKYTSGSSLLLKRGLTYNVNVLFVGTDKTTARALTTGATVAVTLKEEGKFDTIVSLASGDTNVDPLTVEDPYVISLSLNTEALDTYMLVNGNDADDLAAVKCEFEITWTEDAWLTKGATTERLLLTVSPDVRRGDEAAPVPSVTSDVWLSGRAVRFDEVQSLTDPQQQQAQRNIGLPFHLYDGVGVPGLTDDEANTSTNGTFAVGSLWIDSTATPKEAYRCVSAAEGAASWVKTTMDAAEVSDLVDAAIIAYDRRAPYDAGNATGDVTLDTVNGSKQKVTLTGATAARLILPPTGGAEGDYVIIRVTDGGTSPRTLGFDPAIQIPSEYYGTLPKPLGTGLSYKVRLEYDGANWELQTLVGGL